MERHICFQSKFIPSRQSISQSFNLNPLPSVITVFQRKKKKEKIKVLTSASQSQDKIAKILYSQLWSGAERTENYLVSRCTRENYRSLWWQWGEKITTRPTRCIHISFRGKDREACFTSTIQFILRRGWYSSDSVYRGKCNGVKPRNNLQFREARTTRKRKGGRLVQ